ncbi:hypothetical protein FB562_1706 [Homoserinimonas aerilata]|uniref:Secreted protein n=1 Tax=Homoserinimonas aerilata TaxID=1162970 RepID=A0A542YKI0_9MICO|nr:DUF5719 family protein [Homoserinimonas aerilata]TQL48609.1 hypothetical protein FB562_1706 [Homoserinimonas aerilata]
MTERGQGQFPSDDRFSGQDEQFSGPIEIGPRADADEQESPGTKPGKKPSKKPREKRDKKPAEPKVRRPGSVKGAVLVSARLVAGTVGLAVAAATLGAAVFLPLPTADSEPLALDVTPVAAQQQRVCAGPLLRLGDDTGAQASTASALGSPRVTDAADEGKVAISRPQTSDGDPDNAADVLTLAATGGAGEQPLLAGSQAQRAASGDFVGTAAAECTEPSDDIWLVGGATTTGRTTLLSIVNASETPATVSISIYSENGEVTAPGTSAIAVAPGSERIYSLAGLAPGVSAPVVRVQSSGSLVAASMQQATVRTLAAGGLDFVTVGVAPATTAVIPGVVFGDHELLEEAIAGEDFLDLNPVLRVFVPGENTGHATITMVRETKPGAAPAEPVDITVSIDGGRVTELPLGGFDAGSYTATITADTPFVAGVRTTSAAASGVNDFAWLATSRALRERALVPVANGGTASLHLSNPTDTDARATLTNEAGKSVTVEVPAGSAVVTAVAPGSTYTLDDFDRLNASVGFVGEGTIAAHSVSPRGPTSTPLTIYP